MDTERQDAGLVAPPGRQELHHVAILNSIRQMIRAVDLDSKQLASKHQITAPQLMCLLAIIEGGATTAVSISRRVHLSPSTLVGVLDRLEAKQLIRRRRSSKDRREVVLEATEAGRELARRTPFPLQFALERALKGLTPDQRAELAGWLERLVSLMSAERPDAAPTADALAEAAAPLRI